MVRLPVRIHARAAIALDTVKLSSLLLLLVGRTEISLNGRVAAAWRASDACWQQ